MSTILYYSLEGAAGAMSGLRHFPKSAVLSEDDLCSVIIHNHSRVRGADEMVLPKDHLLPGLRTALQSLRDDHSIDAMGDLVPRILRHAHDLKRLFPDGHIATLPRGQAKSTSLTAAQVSCLIANAGLCNMSRIPLPELTLEQKESLRETIPHYGSLSPHLWYQSETRVACERTTALLLYLHVATDPTRGKDADRIITFQRATALPPVMNFRKATKANVSVEYVHQLGIETVKLPPGTSHALMDFANATLHVGALWPTATQEEILFSAYPECLVGVLFCETMADTDGIVISNVRHYIESYGYAERYRVRGLTSSAQESDSGNGTSCIVAADAAIPETLREQLQPSLIQRDVGKATTAWAASGKSVIVTGNWGSGAFGGNAYAKFLHQYLAACRCSIQKEGEMLQLQYCLVGNDSSVREQNMRRLEEWVRALYIQQGEAAVVARLEALTKDEHDDWSLEEQLLKLSASHVKVGTAI